MMDNLFPVCVFDTETTDVPKWSEPNTSPNQAHIVQLSATLLTSPDDAAGLMRWTALVKPELWKDSAPMAFATHGITALEAANNGRPIKEVLEEFHREFLSRCVVMAAFGIDFDMRMLAIDSECCALPGVPEHIQLACVKIGATEACKLAPTSSMSSAGRNYNKPPKLREAVATLLKRDQRKAHDAESDVEDTAELYIFLARKGLIKTKPQKRAADASPDGEAPAAARPKKKSDNFDLPL